MAYAGVIFDLDGVICTTDHYHYLAWKNLADHLGIPFSEEENNQLRGNQPIGKPEHPAEEVERRVHGGAADGAGG